MAVYIIIYHEKLQLNTLVWGSLTLAPIRPYGVLVVGSSLLAKGLREWVIGLGLGLGQGNVILLFSLLSYKMW